MLGECKNCKFGRFSQYQENDHTREKIYIPRHLMSSTIFLLQLTSKYSCWNWLIESSAFKAAVEAFCSGSSITRGEALVQAFSDRKERSLLKLIISATIHTPQEMVSTDWFNNILKSHNSLWLNASDSRHKSNCGGIRWHLNGSRGYRWLWSLDRGRMGKGKMI